MHFFQPKTSKWKGMLVLLDSDYGDKNGDYCTNWIELTASRTSLFDVYLAIFPQLYCDFESLTQYFFCISHKSERTSCILYFSRTYSYFQGWFYKIPGQKALFSNSRSFAGPRLNSRSFPGLCESCISISLHAGKFWMSFCHLLIFSKWTFSKYSFIVKQFGSRSGRTFCTACSGSNSL